MQQPYSLPCHFSERASLFVYYNPAISKKVATVGRNFLFSIDYNGRAVREKRRT
jgi:hypothetical protein